jgi:hypothetical protein
MEKDEKSGIDKANEKRKFWRTLAAVGSGLVAVGGVVMTIVSRGKYRPR